MDTQSQNATPPITKFRAFTGIVIAMLCAVSAEFILGSLSAEDILPYAKSGRMALTFLTIYTLHRFALASFSRYSPRLRDLTAIGTIFIGTLLIVWIGRFIALAGTDYLKGMGFDLTNGPLALEFAIPFAAGALLLQAVLGMHVGMFFSVALSITMGVYSPDALVEVPFILSTTLMACLSLSRFRSRSAYIRAGFNISLVSLPFALSAIILEGAHHPLDVILPLGAALLGGILCSFVAAGVTPIVEAIGGYVTDMRLLEMATLDHPLLKELSIQAPGTWNHSMVMGMMVESAADAVGANPVLARVGAYFHDIGKMKKPLYFVENQVGTENRHDKLSCSMSALIIRSHVKDGIELAKAHNLPTPIVDMIPQHHGTSLIEYFYQKAKKELQESSEEGGGSVDKSLYSYPGPKPQTKEAGILMLADGIEAAARTIKEPTPDRIQGMVQKMINKVFASGQLNECDLTLKDLHLIARNFVRILTSIYHQRIAYAEPAEKGVASSTSTTETKSSETKTSDSEEIESESAQEIISQSGNKELSDNTVKIESTSLTDAPSSSSVTEQTTSETNNPSPGKEEEEEAPRKTKEEDLKRLGIT